MGILHGSYAPQDLDRGEGRNPNIRDVRIQTEFRKESMGRIHECSAGGWGVGHVTAGRFTGSRSLHSLHRYVEEEGRLRPRRDRGLDLRDCESAFHCQVGLRIERLAPYR